MNKTILIADIGLNHNGNLDIAKEIITQCNRCGVDYVKFQKRNPDICVPENQKGVMRDTPWGEMSYLNYRWKLEFGLEEYGEIDKYCNYIGQKWFMSVWDVDSFLFSTFFNSDYVKIPSAKVTDIALLKEAKKNGSKVIISTGGCTIDMVDDAVRALGDSLYGIMQCTSTYPCRADELNLLCMDEYRKRYPGIKIGFSNHFPGMTGNIGAIALGADMLEVHVTLNTSMWGTDQESSCPVDKIPYLMKHINTMEAMRGDGVKRIYDSEIPVMAKLRG